MEIQTIQEKADMYIDELIELFYLNTMRKFCLFDDSLEIITDDENYYTESNEYSFSDEIHDYIDVKWSAGFLAKVWLPRTPWDPSALSEPFCLHHTQCNGSSCH